MTTQTEALKLALEALEPLIVERTCEAMDAGEKAITAIKEALSELEQDDEVLGFNGWGFPIEKPNKAMTTQTEALKALVHEMEYVLSCINGDKIPFDGDDFHEALRLGKEALAQPEQDKERCVGCEACIDTACGRDECPKGWPKAPQRTWVGLTEEELQKILQEVSGQGWKPMLEAIETKLKEKNHERI